MTLTDERAIVAPASGIPACLSTPSRPSIWPAIVRPAWRAAPILWHLVRLPLEPPMIELTLPTMTCGHCVRTVTETVQSVDTRATLVVDLPTHRVQIESSQPAERFSAALAEAGYVPA